MIFVFACFSLRDRVYFSYKSINEKIFARVSFWLREHLFHLRSYIHIYDKVFALPYFPLYKNLFQL